MARVLLLFGGRSAEHEVSCVSAVAVIEALEGGGHQVIPVGIDRQGAWFLADADQKPLQGPIPGGDYAEGQMVLVNGQACAVDLRREGERVQEQARDAWDDVSDAVESGISTGSRVDAGSVTCT